MLRPDFARVNTGVWPAGNSGQRVVLVDAVRAPSLYHVTAEGTNALLRVIWGGSDQQLDNLIPPFEATLSGQLQLFAQPIDTAVAGGARATVARVYGPCCVPTVRGLVTGPEVLQAPAVRLTALDAVVVTPPTLAPVNLTAGQAFPVVPNLAVTSGTVLVEYSI